jgi:hypothetical protein
VPHADQLLHGTLPSSLPPSNRCQSRLKTCVRRSAFAAFLHHCAGAARTARAAGAAGAAAALGARQRRPAGPQRRQAEAPGRSSRCPASAASAFLWASLTHSLFMICDLLSCCANASGSSACSRCSCSTLVSRSSSTATLLVQSNALLLSCRRLVPHSEPARLPRRPRRVVPRCRLQPALR